MPRSYVWACAPVIALSSLGARGQHWPAKSLRVVVPFTAASATDAVARMVSERISASVGQLAVVEKRPGAGGTIGQGIVAKAEPDGYLRKEIATNAQLVKAAGILVTQ